MCPKRRQSLGRSLTAILINISATLHTTTGISPAQMLFHHIPNNGLFTMKPSKTTAVNNRETNYREQNIEYVDQKRIT